MLQADERCQAVNHHQDLFCPNLLVFLPDLFHISIFVQ